MSLTLSTILAAAEHGAAAAGEHAGEEHKVRDAVLHRRRVLVTFAIVISVVGFKQPDFPGTSGAARGVMALSIALVAAAMFSIVYVSA